MIARVVTPAWPATGSSERIVARRTPFAESTLRPVTSGSNQSLAVELHLSSRMLSLETVPSASGAVSRLTSNGISTVIGPVKIADVLNRKGFERISSPDGGVAVASGPASASRRVIPGSVTRSNVILATAPSPGAAMVTELPRKVKPTGVAVRVGVRVTVDVSVGVSVWVGDGVEVAVTVEVGDAVADAVAVVVAVTVEVTVPVAVGVAVLVTVSVTVTVTVVVSVGVTVVVTVPVTVAVTVGVPVVPTVGVGVPVPDGTEAVGDPLAVVGVPEAGAAAGDDAGGAVGNPSTAAAAG